MPKFGPRQMVTVSAPGMRKLVEDLQMFRAKAIPHAVRNALTAMAFEARGEWSDEMRKKFTLRNRFTTSSPRVLPARGVHIPSMESRVGSPLEYLAKQEQGFEQRAKGKHGAPMPTPVAAGQTAGAQKRTRTVRKALTLGAIQLEQVKPRNAYGGRRQRNAVAIRLAAKTGKRLVFLDLGKTKGIFKITGTRRLSVREVWDLSRKTRTVPAHETLGPAVQRVRAMQPSIYASAIVAELRRARILHYSRAAQFGF
jgi:hypothetical protein